MSSTSLEHAEAEVPLGDREGARDRQMTVAQALVSFLLAQYSSRDGEEQRLIPAMFGIFGHG
ncbi:MAG: hypothetical protein ACXVRX_07625, partial [Solirubrobacteraceae bacterium]